MSVNEISLTPTEWHLMECLWEHAPRTGREATDYMAASVGWTRSTTLTMLRRMTEKGLIRCDETDGLKCYSPAIERGDAVIHETEDFLSRVYHGSLSLMLSAMTEKSSLSDEEIAELYDILKKAEEANKA
ncbi:MAG: BlaI/MecI/CopY family transcriptional regulator [Oscillospiraceae bacterium]|nr:BlaI/MecI/CopY family transcriptional regulator [Oscillospiraceae bacterium]